MPRNILFQSKKSSETVESGDEEEDEEEEEKKEEEEVSCYNGSVIPCSLLVRD